MADLVQWASASRHHITDEDTVSPRTVTPKSSAGQLRSVRSVASRGSLRYSPSRKDAFTEDYERRPSPLRSEFRVNGELEQPAAPTSAVAADPITEMRSQTSTPPSPFRLQDAPKTRKKSSGYFALQRSQTHSTQGSYDIVLSGTPPGEPPAAELRRVRTNLSVRSQLSDNTSPLGRPSIQFARVRDIDESPDFPRSGRPDKLKALASPTSTSFHNRQQSSGDASLGTAFMTPGSDGAEPRFLSNVNYGSEADAESSGGEEGGRSTSKAKKRRRRWLEVAGGAATAPSTPLNIRFPPFSLSREESATPTTGSDQRPNANVRRATMTDIPEDSRAGVSEDEGRDRIARRWRRGLEGARGLSYNNASRRRDRSGSPSERRPTAFRRFTGFAAFDGPTSPFRARSERVNSTSAQRWRQVKAGLKLIGQRKKDTRVKVDYEKSAELMAELLAGAPAALFLASMYQRDEHGRKKIPALLEQLKVAVPSSATREDKSGDRHMVFTINLEYGNGPSRMKWTIHRSLRDFANLHLKYKLQSQTERYIQLKGEDRHRAKIPRFPRSAFPYLRGFRGLADEDFEDEEAANDQEGEQSGAEPQSAKKRRQSSNPLSRKPSFHRRKPSSLFNADGTQNPDQAGDGATSYIDRQRKKLEVYLQKMIRWLIFRPDSTRLCKFLELSALAMRLSVEGGYHGKEGLLTITSKRAIERSGLRAFKAMPNRIMTMPDRHKPKWFMVRDSYIVAVDSPESLIPFEVFLIDSDFSTDKRKKRLRDQSAHEIAHTAKASAQPQHHILKLYNAERKLRLLARNERQLAQFKESIIYMKDKSIWSKRQRFDSFAPVRKNVFARWLVDGRDHMWQVSRAIDNARSFVYIHDWWLSPELYLRRPAAISQKWRLDRLLLEKAQQGVKIFVIVYRNIESAIPIDSEHTKAHLLELHPNICVQRSPNQFRQNQFFWAHHEKLVVVDNAMAFVGGVDLCFGRWDDPHHVLTDDKLTGFESDFPGPRNSQTCQLWPGKDYSNPRVQDFYALDQPYEEMYDRTKVPRMPWHDISMCIVGQPARDVARHFVQRWNYILRQRTPSRPTPVLLPPPEFEQEELDKMGMTGTCQIQILRSCSSWSIGTPNKTECSIMNAYEHLIKNSDHFVYIENQFFISSCVVEGTKIHNKIGDALVERIELAEERGDKWRACIIIPLMPGFQNSVDSQDGTSVRLIMQCQYRSICRGESSIFGRLRAKGIDPTRYIEFYALRQWGKIGPNHSLTTEQLYIHAKCMVVDDRAAIIGSANINERSLLGSRDSEVAALVIDQETLPSYMDGKPYAVGVFPHTLRMRLMREHLGIDVDELYREEEDDDAADGASVMQPLNPQKVLHTSRPTTPRALTEQNLAAEQSKQAHDEARLSVDSLRAWISKTGNDLSGQSTNTESEQKEIKDMGKGKSYGEKLDLDVQGFGFDNYNKLEHDGVTSGRETFINTHGHEVLSGPADAYEPQSQPTAHKVHLDVDPEPHMSPVPPWKFPRLSTAEMGLTQLSQLPALPSTDDTDIGGPPITRSMSAASAGVIKPLLNSIRRPMVEDSCMQDPLADSFINDIWHKVAENNTKIYRQVFRCMPDSEVQSWKEYREYNTYYDKFMQSQGLSQNKPKPAREAPATSGPPGSVGTDTAAAATEKVMKGAAKSGNRLSGFANKVLRPGSRGSELGKNTTASEKDGNDVASPHDEGDIDEKADLRTEPTPVIRFPSPELGKSTQSPDPEKSGHQQPTRRSRAITFSGVPEEAHDGVEGDAAAKKRRRAATRSSMRFTSIPDEVLVKEDAEELLKLVQGHLVLWPYDWLEKEEKGGNWLYNIDQIAPLEI
ncbi:hypothetical protein ANO11243_090700 [Dothideomycetidae sp. 11243]|nr:hypothetical protein ANO11243_090700 [fungal sp. No.11243]